MGQFVIACYRPKPGKDAELLEEVRKHVPTLRELGLATDRPTYVMRAKDGTIVEVFEWRSQQAIDEAHANETVLAMWARFEAACAYEMIGNLAEAKQMFSPFEPVEV